MNLNVFLVEEMFLCVDCRGYTISKCFTYPFISLARMDRYNHDLGGDDTDETEDSPLIGSFSSYSPQYRRQNSSRFPNQLNDKLCTTMSPNHHDVKMFTRPELRKLDVRT